jgi:hypothetical protein
MTEPSDPSIRPLKPRRNGWTAERQAAFLEALADTASVTEAARRVRMTPQSAHWLRRQPAAAEFRAAWAAALAETLQQVTQSALDRVMNGEECVIEADGMRIVRRRPCAPSLVIHMLERAAAAKERGVKVSEIGKLGK